MNNLAYNSQDPEKVGPKVEEIIRKEVNASAPVPYRVESGNAAPYTVGSAIKEALIGGKTDMLFRLDFDLAEPRPARLEVSIDKMGIGCFAGTLLYSARISRPVAGEVALEPPKTFGKSKFTGEPSTAGRLNSNGDLVSLANKFARTESRAGGGTLKRERFFKIMPDGSGSVLVVASLPRTTSMGFSATVDAKDFFDLAALVEASL